MLRPMSATSDRPEASGHRRIVVALDGPGSSGKSTVGAAAAARFGLRFVDTGLLYRALTALALREGVATDDARALVALVDRVMLADDGTGRLTRVLLDGSDATEQVHTDEVDAAVSAVSRVPEVRAALMPRQRALAADGGIVVAGRDIGTIVLPDADLKLFLDASVEERAARRIEERGLDPHGEEAAIVLEQLRARDAQDSSRTVAPLRAAADALHIRTDGNTFEQTVGLIAAAIDGAMARPNDVPTDDRRSSRGRTTAPGPTAPAKKRNPLLDVAMRMDNDKTMLVRMCALVSRICVRLVANVRIEGLERIPRTGAVILAINHISNIDPFVTGAWITTGMHRRRIHFLGKKELFDWPVFGWLGAHGGIHPVDRSTADIEAYRLATRILESGYVLEIFPEGTRSPNGALQEAKDGMAQLALRTGATVVPIGVNNTDAVWPKGRRLPSPIPRRTITVRVGEPFQVAGLVPPETDRRAAKTAATTAIMGRIAELLDERHRGVYASAVRAEAVARR